jgi:hypothetical protein
MEEPCQSCESLTATLLLNEAGYCPDCMRGITVAETKLSRARASYETLLSEWRVFRNPSTYTALCNAATAVAAYENLRDERVTAFENS